MEKKPWEFPARNMDDSNHPLGSGMPSDVGKAASALLAKHVRTLEVLFSLQRENAKLKQESQVGSEISVNPTLDLRCAIDMRILYLAFHHHLFYATCVLDEQHLLTDASTKPQNVRSGLFM